MIWTSLARTNRGHEQISAENDAGGLQNVPNEPRDFSLSLERQRDAQRQMDSDPRKDS